MEEYFDLYDINRVKTDKKMLRYTQQPQGFYRVVVHICIFNSEGKMLIQQRQPFKKGFSGLWDISVGGAVISGETSNQSAERELYEELGIKHSFENVRPSMTTNFPSGFDDIYIINKDVDISKLSLQYEEVKAVKWASADEIITMIDDETFIPYEKSFIQLLFYRRNKSDNFSKPDPTKPPYKVLPVKFYDNLTEEQLADESLVKFAVIIAKYNGKYVFCKHKNRDTYEIPGGHREKGETLEETARRELYEETGAKEFTLKPICAYKVDDYGMLYYAEITKLENELHSEIERIELFDIMPENLTYPYIQPYLMIEAKKRNIIDIL